MAGNFEFADVAAYVILTLLYVTCSVVAQCPNTQQCTCDSLGDLTLNCRSNRLNSVPDFADTNFEFTEVTLANNQIRTLPANAFKTQPSNVGLKTAKLDLSSNPITDIHQDAFLGLEDHLEIIILHVDSMASFPTQALQSLVKLKQIHIKGFSISEFPDGAFSAHRSLEYLSAEDCDLQSLSSADFTNQRLSLKELYLEKNRFTTVPKQAINSLSALEVLNLKQNQINQVTDDDFSQMSMIHSLDMSYNGISTISSNAFRGIEDTLLSLSLSNNGNNFIHSDLSPLERLSELQVLDVSYNGINQIPNGLFRLMDQLQTLNMDNNQISAISTNSFNGLGQSVQSVNLASNDILDIAQFSFESLTGLKTLVLNGNPLGNSINDNTFIGLENSLETLNLRNTGFQTSDFTSIAHLSRLKSLILRDNNINSVPDDTFVNLQSMEALDLAGNSISNLAQRSLNGFQSSLKNFNLDTNNIESLTSCLFYGFHYYQNYELTFSLNENPLRCDCDAFWLRFYLEEKYGDDAFALAGVNWICASPDDRVGDQLKDIPLDDLCAGDSSPDTEECETYATTPASTSLTTTQPTSPPPARPIEVGATDITSHSMRITWVVLDNAEAITHFTLTSMTVDGDIHTENKRYNGDARHADLNDMQASTTYTTCVTPWADQTSDASYCTDATTDPSLEESTSRFTPLQVILGAVLAGLVFIIIVGIIIVCIVIRKRKKNRHPLIGGKSTTTLNETPAVGDHSKRFSKPKAYSVDMSLCSNGELESRLEGFSPEERDRILQLFSRNNQSTLSMASATSMRYVPDPYRASSTYPNNQGAAYSNQIPVQEDGPYEELPGDQYNYIPFDEINPDISQPNEPMVQPPPLRPESYV